MGLGPLGSYASCLSSTRDMSIFVYFMDEGDPSGFQAVTPNSLPECQS